MRCCKHYSPSALDMEDHDGLQMNDVYPFDKLLPHPSCTNKEMVGNNLFGTCPFARNQDICGFYEPEELQILQAVSVKRNGQFDLEIRLEVARVTFGITEFYISHTINNVRTVHHSVNAHEHGEQARTMAYELFEFELRNYDEDNIVPISTEENTDVSYIYEVANAI